MIGIIYQQLGVSIDDWDIYKQLGESIDDLEYI